MNCEEFQSRLAPFADGEIPVDPHAEVCASCRRELEQTRAVLRMLESLEPEIPDVDLRERLRPRLAVRRRGFAAVAAGLAAAASLLVIWALTPPGAKVPGPEKPGEAERNSPDDFLQAHEDRSVRFPDEIPEGVWRSAMVRYESPHKFSGFVAPPRKKKEGRPELVIGRSVDSLRVVRATEVLEDMAERAFAAQFGPRPPEEADPDVRRARALVEQWRADQSRVLADAVRKSKFRLAVPTYLPDDGLLRSASVSGDGRSAHLVYWSEIGQFSLFLSEDPTLRPAVRTILTRGAEFKVVRRRLLDVAFTLVTSELSWSQMDWIADSMEFYIPQR